MNGKVVFHTEFKNAGDVDLWEAAYPREPLKPVFEKNDGEIGIKANGNPYVFGYWTYCTDVEGGKTYTLKVKFKVTEIEDINLHVLNIINWRIKGKHQSGCPHDQVSCYIDHGDYITGEQTFTTAKDVCQAEIQLGIRYIKSGKVTWYEVSLEESEPEKSRIINVAAVKWNSGDSRTIENNLLEIGTLLDQAGALKSDIVLLPEFTNYYSGEVEFENIAEEIQGGRTCELVSSKARQHKMNVCMGIVEKDGDLLFNTAVMYNRSGDLVGKYRKVHLYWPEAIFNGESPGDEHPVFDLDIGKVGVIICYDSWFPETTRILALKGADLVLFPNAGYEPLIIPARAIDNGVYFAVSSLFTDAMIVDTKGSTLARTQSGIICTQIDISRKAPPHPNAGGSMNSAPAGRRGVRNSMSARLYEEIKKEVGTWSDRYEKHTWI